MTSIDLDVYLHQKNIKLYLSVGQLSYAHHLGMQVYKCLRKARQLLLLETRL